MKHRWKRRLWKDERGSATIEAVLWTPIFVFFILLVVDASMLFFNQAQVFRIVQDNNRAFAVGRVESLAETEANVRAALAAFSRDATVESTVQGNFLRTDVSVRAGDLGGVGLLAVFRDLQLRISAQHLVES